MTMLVFTLVFAVLWAGQMYLSWRQARAFLAGVATLRTDGDVVTGLYKRRLRRTYAAIAVKDGAITGSQVLDGVSLFARPRCEPRIIGLAVEDLTGAALTTVGPRTAGAVAHAAALYKPRRSRRTPTVVAG
jgi:DNA-binding transcriptional regulator of glucitol operon